jgi:predicted nucleotidyltransferase component of viral defense system
MLQKNPVRKPLWNLLKDLQKSCVFENYFLVGGTALSLQLGHRMSDDIDLFTRTDINKDEVFDFLNSLVRPAPRLCVCRRKTPLRARRLGGAQAHLKMSLQLLRRLSASCATPLRMPLLNALSGAAAGRRTGSPKDEPAITA